jgi:hypothetical protein
MRSHDTFILGKPTSDVCEQSVSLGTSSGQVHESWERHHNERACTRGGQCVAQRTAVGAPVVQTVWCTGPT